MVDVERIAGLVRVVLHSEALTVSLLDLGASIEEVRLIDADGTVAPVHLRLPSVAEYGDRSRNPHLGASVGRYANRIAGAAFELDGRRFELDPNDGPNQLHGGPDGFSRRTWALADHGASADGGWASFTLHSADGDQGYPGALDAQVTYELRGTELRIAYTATCDEPTVVNLCNHAYWDLTADPARPPGTGTIDAHVVTVAADRYLPVDDAGIPTGGLTEVVDTPFDLRRPTELARVLAELPEGIDNCYEIRTAPAGAASGDGSALPGELRFAARLEAPSTGRWLSVHTDQPGLQVYTGNVLAEPFARQGAVSLEAQRFPDTPNRPWLGSARLDPGETYRSTTDLRFGTT